MFLDHLDHPCFKVVVSTINTQLRNMSSVPPEYIDPALASAIDQFIDIPPMTSQGNLYTLSPRIHNLYDDSDFESDLTFEDLSLEAEYDDIPVHINSTNREHQERPENPYNCRSLSSNAPTTFPSNIPLRSKQPRGSPWRCHQRP